MRIFAVSLALALHGLQDGGRGRGAQVDGFARLKEIGRGLRCFLLRAAALETADSLSLFFIFFQKK